MSAKINQQLSNLIVPVAGLQPDDSNSRTHDRTNIDAIKASYSRFGQQKPIVSMTSGKVIAGNGSLVAAIELGWDEIASLTFDNEDEAEAAAYALADNKTAELAGWDYKNLSETLQSLPKQAVEATGFSETEIDAIIANSKWEGLEDEAVPKEGDSEWHTFVRIRVISKEAYEEVKVELAAMSERYGDQFEVLG